MNQKQYELAFSILKNDCKIRHRYVNKNGETCAIGALAEATGVWVTPGYHKYGNSRKIGLHNGGGRLAGKFGLSLTELSYIQEANDAHSSRERRVKAVLEALDAIATRHGLNVLGG